MREALQALESPAWVLSFVDAAMIHPESITRARRLGGADRVESTPKTRTTSSWADHYQSTHDVTARLDLLINTLARIAGSKKDVVETVEPTFAPRNMTDEEVVEAITKFFGGG